MKLGWFVPGLRILLKKPHPCGGKEWLVVRVGMDIKLRCLTCGREVKMLREKLKKQTVKVIVPEGDES
jgi:hypothetical protein